MTSVKHKHILPKSTEAAFTMMIDLTQNAISAFEDETNALAIGDDLKFYQASTAKQTANMRYLSASEEFIARKTEFISFGGNRLEQLLALQKELAQRSEINIKLLEPLQKITNP